MTDLPATTRGENVAWPSVGRVVHAWLTKKQAQPIAAIVTEFAQSPTLEVSLAAFDPRLGMRVLEMVPYGETYSSGPRWSWPPRT